MKVLVVVAHADDEILGCGGTLIKHRDNNDEINICVATEVYYPLWDYDFIIKLKENQRDVDRQLKCNRFFLGFKPINLYLHSDELNRKVTDLVYDIKPDVVYTHYRFDVHSDHKAVFDACMVACRPPLDTKLVCFETISETEWGFYGFHPNLWVNIEKQINEKKQLFSFYKSEIRDNPHPRNMDGIEILARKRGMDVCLNYAEAFQIIKEYWV